MKKSIEKKSTAIVTATKSTAIEKVNATKVNATKVNATKVNATIDFSTLVKSTMNNTELKKWYHANDFEFKSNTNDSSNDVYNTFATNDRIQLTKKVNHFNLWLTATTATELETECKKLNVEVFIKPVNDGKRKFKCECDENVMNVFYNLMKSKPCNKMV